MVKRQAAPFFLVFWFFLGGGGLLVIAEAEMLICDIWVSILAGMRAELAKYTDVFSLRRKRKLSEMCS